MKISKLFHWLYACILFLPIAYILSRCLYVIFNDNAIASVPLDSIFIDSVNNINTLTLFSWASSSFLNVPITYISDLFGISAGSPILTLLSYWLAISIIWLCFDVIMYLPLLFHRLIDKAVID